MLCENRANVELKTESNKYERVVSIIASENSSGWKGTSGKVTEPNLCLKARKKPHQNPVQSCPMEKLVNKTEANLFGREKVAHRIVTFL